MSTLLKDYLDHAALQRIAAALAAVEPTFAADAFVGHAHGGLAALELKQRVRHITTVLAHYLPADFSAAAQVLQQLPAAWQVNADSADYGFAAWPLLDYVAVYGLQHPELSLSTLKALTPLFTAEFAIRPFLHRHFELSYAHLQRWALDDNHHVRRLASEGCRPRLPWGQRVPALMHQPDLILPILECLKDDDSDYVRLSVANNLNDISKDYPDVVIALARRWLAAESSAQRQWIIKHATRGLVKAGHADALGMLGFAQDVRLEALDFRLSVSELALHDSLQLDVAFDLPQAQELVIDFALHLPRANGKHSIKVFKWKTGAFAAGKHSLSQRYSFRPLTTRRYYPGRHTFELKINGQSLAHQHVHLRLAAEPS